MPTVRWDPSGRARRSWNRCLANAEASRPCCSCRLPARPVASLGTKKSANGREIGARPWPIHSASCANSWVDRLGSLVGAGGHLGGVDREHADRQADVGSVTVGHIHQLKGIQRRQRHPAGDHRICTASIMAYTPRVSIARTLPRPTFFQRARNDCPATVPVTGLNPIRDSGSGPAAALPWPCSERRALGRSLNSNGTCDSLSILSR